MEWFAAALGNVEGTLETGSLRTHLAPCESVRIAEKAWPAETLVVSATSGKFSTSEDSFLFCGCKIDPNEQNLSLAATVVATQIDGGADSQSGFGLMAMDTDSSRDKRCRHRNQLLLGNFGIPQFGVRLVGGYEDPDAEDPIGRIADQSRLFEGDDHAAVFGKPHMFSLEKTSEGFIALCDGVRIDIPGCGFLMQQHAQELCIGFACARGLRMEISDIVVSVTEGSASQTPEGELVECVPDYPFPRNLLEDAAVALNREQAERGVAGPFGQESFIYVSPDGSEGGGAMAGNPTTIHDAIARATPGAHIILADGEYRVDEPIVVPRHKSGAIDAHITLEAEHPRLSILDGGGLSEGLPLFALDADYWDISGIVFRNSPLSGLTILGNVNTIANCEAAHNGDTGILVISRPGAVRGEWPQRNSIVDCDSHDNCDRYRCNADGFGAKLRVGKGNHFYRCIAYRNIDDGFDLYTKSTFGPTSPVELDMCIAYENGKLTGDGMQRPRPGGVGFKLGGENQAVAHEAWNCIALSNGQAGFSANSNPACSLRYCTSSSNGASEKDEFDGFAGTLRDSLILPRERTGNLTDRFVKRAPDGFLSIPSIATSRSKRGKRLGASLGEPKNILVFVTSLSGGGAERVACRLANALSERHSVCLMYTHKKDEPQYPVADAVRRIEAIPPKLKVGRTIIGRTIRRMRLVWFKGNALRKACRAYDIDDVISLLVSPNTHNVLFGGRRRIVSERNDPSRGPKSEMKRARFNYEHADCVVFQSRKVQGMFSQNVRDKSIIIPNPVSVDCCADATPKKKMVAVARLHPQKNHKLLIRAFAVFHASHPDFHLHLYGSGSELDGLIELTETLGMGEYVHFEGFRADVHQAISDAEMFVLSSDFEGMPNALIEAMKMGLPCISTACTGSDELITDGEDGLLTPVNDEEALCAAMCRLADDSDLRARLAKQAQLRALDFTVENAVRKWERIL